MTNTPQDVISSIINLQYGDWAPIFSYPTNDLIGQYFSTRFIADWNAAMVYNTQFAVWNGDPLSGYSAVNGITLLSNTVVSQTDSVAVIDSSIQMNLPEATSDYQVTDIVIRFTLILQSYIWVVDDYLSYGPFLPTNFTAREYLRDVVANPASYV